MSLEIEYVKLLRFQLTTKADFLNEVDIMYTFTSLYMIISQGIFSSCEPTSHG